MQSTIKHTDGGWEVTAKLLQPTDDEYYITTVYHPQVEPGDTVEVQAENDEFNGVVLGTSPVVTLSPEVRDAF